jgi:hypothetical protein
MDDSTAVALAAVIGLLVGFLLGYLYGKNRLNSTTPRYAGEIEVVADELTGKAIYSLNLIGEPEDLLAVDEVYFRIVGNRK